MLIIVWYNLTMNSLSILITILAVLGFEFSASCLLCRCFSTWTMPLALVALLTLEIGSHCFSRQVWTTILLFYASFIAGMNYCQLFSTEMGVLNFFAWAGFDHSPPSLSLPNSQNYRHESPAPRYNEFFLFLEGKESLLRFPKCIFHILV
jgi:hypothetical protein